MGTSTANIRRLVADLLRKLANKLDPPAAPLTRAEKLARLLYMIPNLKYRGGSLSKFKG